MLGSNTTTARVRLALEGQGEVVRGLAQVQAGFTGMRTAMASLAGGLSLGAAVSQLVQVQREMDVLNASMVTVTGSSRAAELNMQWIKRFAAQTPYQLNEVTGAFVKMKALGLDASEAALRSYGNTASAMGKDLNQFIEAVADAATGEFERLKEFGIKAKKEGDSVAFTFQGVTTRLRNNAADITGYLKAIGDGQFAGAMERRMDSLDGKISNLADSWDELARTVNEAGVGTLIETTVVGATKAIAGLGDAIRDNKAELAVLAGGLGGAALAATLPRVGAGFMLVAGGVRALSLALAANPLTLAFLGIGAAVGAWSVWSKQRAEGLDGMKAELADLEKNLRQRGIYDDRSAAGNARFEQEVQRRLARIKELRSAIASLDPPVGSVASGDVLLRRAQAEAEPPVTGETPLTAAELAAQKAARRKAEQAALKEANQAAQDLAEARERILQMEQRTAEVYVENADAMAESNLALRDEIEAIGQTTEERAHAIRVKEEQIIADKKLQLIALQNADADATTLTNLQREIDLRQQRLGLLDEQARKEVAARDAAALDDTRERARRLAQETTAEFAKANEQIAQSLTDSLFEGGKSFLDNLSSYARTIVLRPILAPIGTALASIFTGTTANAASLLGLGGGGSGSAAAGGSGITLSGLSNLFQGLTTNFSNAVTQALTSLTGNSVGQSLGLSYYDGNAYQLTGTGNMIGTGLGYLGGAYAGIGLGRSISGGYSAIGKSGNTAVNAGTIIGSIFGGPIGGAIGGAIGGVVNRVFGRKLAGQGITGDFRDGAFTGNSFKYYEGGLLRDDKTTYGDMDPVLAKALSDRFAAITASTVAAANALGLQGSRANDATFTGLSFDFSGKTQDEIDAWFNQMFTGIADYQAQLFDGLQALVRDGETASGTLQRLATSLQGVNAIFDTLGTAAYQVSLAGGDMARQLADLFGGIEAFGTSAAAYYQAFYSGAERTATATRQLTTQLAALGLQLPNSRASFRALVEAQDLTTESGRETYSALLRLSPAFADLTAAIDSAGSGIAAEITRLRGLSGSSTTAQGYAALQAQFATTTAAARAGSSSALEALPGISQALEEAASMQATTAAELNLIRQKLTASLQATMAGLGLQVPSLDVGTNYVPHDMLIMAHRGEAVVPAAYNPALAGAGGPGGGDVVVELQALRRTLEQVLAGQESGLTAVAMHTASTARALAKAQPTNGALLIMTQAEFDAL